jgi:hypothetical protein
MPDNLFYQSDPLVVCLVLLAVLVASAEIGSWVKKAEEEDRPGNIEKSDIALVIGAVLTLLALLLGFTYAMSEGRFETRRQLVIEETNAIGTTYLRAKTLPEPTSSEVQELLRRYTALRVESAGRLVEDPAIILEINTRTKQLHSLLWSHAAAIAKKEPNPVVALFLQTLNEMIDLHTKRLAAFRNRVPSSIYLVLFAVSAIALWLTGYYFGPRGRRAHALTAMLAFLVAAVMWLIMDLDQPLRGAIRTSQQSLIDLNQELSQESRDATKKSHRIPE